MHDLVKIFKHEAPINGKNILIIGVFHGDEFQGEYFINSYLKNNYPNPKNTLYFIPRLNQNNERKNPNGVDLNRNFPTKNWVLSENNDYFGGIKPNSEIETRFLVDLIDKVHFDAIITIHAPYKVINYDGPAESLAKIASQYLGYGITSDIGYPTPGSFGTYCGIERNIPVLTVEIDENDDIEKLNKKFCEFFNYLKYDF